VAVDAEELYRRYGPMVHRRCLLLLRDPQRAVEASQDVFVQLLRRGDALEVQSPAALLHRMATNVCLNHLRSRRRRPEDADDTVVDRIAALPDADERVGAAALLDRLFARVPDPMRASTRAIAVMHLVDGMTLEEVADETGMSVSGVRKRLRTLREHLHELEGY
jgi:RNA polymerase sigma-70 factor (ECF subfamily)